MAVMLWQVHNLLGSLKPLQEERNLLFRRLDELNPGGGKQIKYEQQHTQSQCQLQISHAQLLQLLA